MKKVGILSLQGDFAAHGAALSRAGAEPVFVRDREQLQDLDGLVIPGGESTVMGKLMVTYGLDQPLRELLAAGVPTWGTCAGLILLSRETDNALAGQPLLAAMDIRTKRNAFGPQRASFEADIAVPALGEDPYHAVFIRAPVVESTGAGVEVMARLDDLDGAGDGTIVAVRQGHLMGTAFHPEVTGDTRFHDYFLRLVRGVRG